MRECKPVLTIFLSMSSFVGRKHLKGLHAPNNVQAFAFSKTSASCYKNSLLLRGTRKEQRCKRVNRPFGYSARVCVELSFLYCLIQKFRGASELLGLLCTFENFTKYMKISFGSDSFLECLKGLFRLMTWNPLFPCAVCLDDGASVNRNDIESMPARFENGEKCNGKASHLHENVTFFTGRF